MAMLSSPRLLPKRPASASSLKRLSQERVDLVDFGGAKTLIGTRYELGRTRGTGKAWLRLHQEDLLQVMSCRPEKKYQADGGRA
jgi:serine/threonine-protein kinase HipA